MHGGMAGSHLRWGVYEDMVNRVWPQASEQERRNMFLIMRRDLGTYWRPDGWNGHSHMTDKGEGIWKADDNGMAFDHNNPDDKPVQVIHDLIPWMYFRQVLARFDPDNQYAVTMRIDSSEQLESMLRLTPKGAVVSCPTLYTAKGYEPTFDLSSAPFTVRAYRWQDEYRIDWSRRCAEDSIIKVEKLEIPDNGTM